MLITKPRQYRPCPFYRAQTAWASCIRHRENAGENLRLKALGIECLTLTVDDPTSVAACHDQVVTLLDGEGLHYLINNAGFGML
jgi:hypothetical protein